MQQKQILNMENAYKIVLEEMLKREQYKWRAIFPLNRSEKGIPRYRVVLSDQDNIFIKFSREPYKSGEGGFRESINVEGGLREAFMYKVKRLFFIYPDGKIYFIHLLDFMLKADKRITNNEQKTIYTILLSDLQRYNNE